MEARISTPSTSRGPGRDTYAEPSIAHSSPFRQAGVRVRGSGTSNVGPFAEAARQVEAAQAKDKHVWSCLGEHRPGCLARALVSMADDRFASRQLDLLQAPSARARRAGPAIRPAPSAAAAERARRRQAVAAGRRPAHRQLRGPRPFRATRPMVARTSPIECGSSETTIGPSSPPAVRAASRTVG